jgi:hypothetical protein
MKRMPARPAVSFGPDHPICKQLQKRCDDSHIKCEWTEDPFPMMWKAVISLRCGRKTREVRLAVEHEAQEFLAIPFENWSFVGNYWAICSYQSDCIEAFIQSLEGRAPHLIFPVLSGKDQGEDGDRSQQVVELSSSLKMGELRVIIGPPSDELRILGRNRSERAYGPSIRIENTSVSSHDEALSVLEQVSNTVFFQIDLMLNFPVGLARVEPPSDRWYYEGNIAPQLNVPERSYDNEAIALYWYARSSGRMPLLQYLGYYQCIEFYFPAFSQEEVRRRISNVLKDPTFNSEKASDIGRIMAALMPVTKLGFPDERSQLASVFRECLDEEDLRKFLTDASERETFFAGRNSKLKCHPIPVNDSRADLRNEVATRIYRLRCRIVHSKTEGGKDADNPLLPFSEESYLLGPDIELIRYAARKVLIAASSPMTIW